MQVKEIMTRDVKTVAPHETLQAAAATMKELDVGLLPVCEGDRLLGMITDRDITVRGVADGADAGSHRVRDVMTTDVIFCYEDQDVHEVARLMTDKQVRRLVALSRDRRLVGIVSLGDLAVQTGDEQLAGETLENVSRW
jgi:CBS domain-containing protein